MANKTYLTQRDYMEMTGAEPPSDFVMLEAAARKRIDYLTASRVAKMEESSVSEALTQLMVKSASFPRVAV